MIPSGLSGLLTPGYQTHTYSSVQCRCRDVQAVRGHRSCLQIREPGFGFAVSIIGAARVAPMVNLTIDFVAFAVCVVLTYMDGLSLFRIARKREK